MTSKIVNKLKRIINNGLLIGGNVEFIMSRDKDRGFVITCDADISPVYYFTGRETELKELRQWIEDGRKSVLVSGMGGIGKTQICRKIFREYVEKHSKGEHIPFQYIGFIEYSGDMNNDLKNCLNYEQWENSEKNKEAAWKKLFDLASNGKLLLFVDNVNRPLREDPGLERLKSIPGAIILTSRRAAFSKEFEPYTIGFLNTEQCREIYEKIRFMGSGIKIKDEELSDLEYIIEKLAARHTITIEFLASLARTKHWSVERLKEELEQNGFKLEYKNEEDELVNIQKEYEKLYDLSGMVDAEKNILEAFSVFPYIPLPTETCNEWLLSDAGINEDDDILMGLYQKGWLQFDCEQESFAMHPVFAQFIYDMCRPNAEKHAGLIRACQDRIKIPTNNFLLECQKYIPFAESVIEKMSMENSMERVEFINMLAQLLRCSGEYKKAEKWFKESLKICEELLGEDNCDTANIYDGLGQVYELQREYEKAKELYEMSLSIRERVFGENHCDTAASYCCIATIYWYQKKYEKANELYEKSLAIYENNELEIATLYNNLAGLYRAHKDYSKAEELHKKSLDICVRVLGENHIRTAISYRNLAGVYLNTHKYKKAKNLYKKSLKIYEDLVGEDHPDTLLTYNDLGMVYFCTYRFKKAERYHLKAYKASLDNLGSSHPYTNLFLQNLKLDYYTRKRVSLL